MGRLALWIVLLLAALGAIAPPARAADARCLAVSDDTGSLSHTLAGPLAWSCPGQPGRLSAHRHIVRFALDPARPLPTTLVSRIAAFEDIAVAWRAADGSIASRTRTFAQLHGTWLERRFAMPLPRLPAGTRTLWVAIDEPTQTLPLDYLALARAPPGSSDADRDALILAALLCGLILMPLLFDAVFWRVLREPFILWHMAFVASMAAQLVLTQGLYLPLIDPSLRLVRIATVGSFGTMVFAAAMFLSTFVEKGMLTRRIDRMLRLSGVAMLALTALHAPGFLALGELPADAFYLSGFPVAAVFLIAATSALRRGSRMVRYVLVGFAPLLLVSLIRVVSFALPGVPVSEATTLFLAGMLMEVGATALGVAARFMTMRDERDHARREAANLESLAGRDPLTGLMNRRAIEPRFAELREAGYAAFALIDLDHFKSVNDTHGHAVGDDVLRATGAVLAETADCFAIRLGGEEFLLLLSGEDAEERAERLRASLPLRIAHAVEALSRPVTASMGLIVAPHAALPRARFNDLYVMADKLLYEAKAAGRNRTFSERVRGFRAPRRERRRAA
jgi:diguanylate cyclase (GGDEF)-like protein